MAQYESLLALRAKLQGEPNPQFVHFYPRYGKEHICGAPGVPCWCNPYFDDVDGRIVVHSPSH